MSDCKAKAAPCQEEQSGPPEVLRDSCYSWKHYKRRNLKLARIYDAAEMYDYACRANMCATWLQFGVSDDGRKRLMGSNFCNLRLCPLCISRRARAAAAKLSQIMDTVQVTHPGTVYLFLTLTVRNCSGQALGDTLGLLTKAWDRLRRQRQVERSVQGWYRAIEITRNPDDGTYHPHIHAILAVSADYFAVESGQYITHDDWVERWRRALRVDYRPSVQISRTRGKSGKGDPDRAAVLEAAKYACKDTDYIDPRLSLRKAAVIVSDYTHALYRRRLTALGGTLKAAAGVAELDSVDLVHGADEQLRPDVTELVEDYRWQFGAGDYVLAARRRNPDYQGGGDGDDDRDTAGYVADAGPMGRESRRVDRGDAGYGDPLDTAGGDSHDA